MMLAGLIASSYSYDHAISEEEELKIFRSLRKGNGRRLTLI